MTGKEIIDTLKDLAEQFDYLDYDNLDSKPTIEEFKILGEFKVIPNGIYRDGESVVIHFKDFNVFIEVIGFYDNNELSWYEPIFNIVEPYQVTVTKYKVVKE